MRKKSLFISLLAVLVYSSTHAQDFYTVSNDPSFNANYTSLQAAHDAVPAGSTLYLLPSQKSYGDVTLTKRLKIYGTGFLLNENLAPNTQASGGTAIVSAFIFRPGSDGSVVEGVELTESGTLGGALYGNSTSRAWGARFTFDSVSNITISRCYARSLENVYSAICSMDSANNCLIKQCYFSIGVGNCPTINGGAGGNAPAFNLINYRSWATSAYKIKNVTFANNIISAYAHCGANNYYYLSFPAFNASSRVDSLKFINNTFLAKMNELYNNVAGDGGNNLAYTSNQYCTRVRYTNNVFQNPSGTGRFFSFGSSRFFGPTSNNVSTDTSFFITTSDSNADAVANVLQRLYANGSSSLDGSHQIQNGNMALTYAAGGGQAGAFGGQYPFKLSGIPDYPYPYAVKVSTKATIGGTLPVKIKAKAGNQ